MKQISVSNLKWITIGMLLLLLFLQRECHRCPDPEPEIVYKTKKVTIPGDSVPYEVEVPGPPVPVYRDTGSTQWKYHQVDTMAILSDYFATFFYADTISDDTSMVCIINDWITENKIKRRAIKFMNLRPIVYKTIVTPVEENEAERQRFKMFLGPTIGRSPEEFGIGPSVMVITSRENAYALDYDMINKDIYLKYYWKIKLKK